LQPHEPASSPPRQRELNPVRGPARRTQVPESEDEEEEEEEEEDWVPQQPNAGRLAMKLPENHKQQQQENHEEDNHTNNTNVTVQDGSIRRGAMPPLSEDSVGTNGMISGRGSRGGGFFPEDHAVSRSVSSRVRPPVKELKLDPDDPWSAIEVEYAGGGGYNSYLPAQEDHYHQEDHLRGPLHGRNNGVELELGDDGTLVEVVGKGGGSK